jgi:hypothetical protein
MAMPLIFTSGGARFGEIGGLTPRIGSDPWSRLMDEERRRHGG